MLDRESPRARPPGPAKGYQRWESLLFLHWQVPVEVMRGLVPSELELDLFEGRAYIGLVPFAMKNVRPRWSPRSLAFQFLETNVRTYVHYQGRPGVYFLSLEAASRIAVWIARAFWGLPYFHARMSMKRQATSTLYSTVRDRTQARLEVEYRIGEPLGPSLPDSTEFFFLERYLLFLERGSRIYSGQVYHTPYPAHRAEVIRMEENLLATAGVPVAGPPVLAHYSPGVDVEVFALRPCR